jgi:nucleoside-diphosphate-sugar epimerase
VLGLTHSPESASHLSAEIAAVACDISSRESVKALGVQEVEAVIHCASSGRGGADQYRAVYLDGTRHLLEALTPQRFLFASSTSVYAQTDGGWVMEESAAEPSRDTGRVLRETEEFVLARGGIVARLAGIYGPGRSVLLRKFFSGEAVIEGDGRRWINQIHRDDIASAFKVLVEHGPSGIYNVCDDRPMTQAELYGRLAEKFGQPLPPHGPIDPNRKRGWTNKRVSNAKLRALGWVPRWPGFFEAVAGEEELVRQAKDARPEM